MIDYISDFNNTKSFIEEKETQTINKRNNENLKVDLYSMKVDYILPAFIWGISLESGVKYTFATSKSYNNFEEDVNKNWAIIPEYSYQYNFDESIMAAYFSATKNMGKFNVNAGLRWEYYETNAFLYDTLKISDINSNDLFPSVSLNYDFSDNLIVSINYSKRIYRPSY